MNGNTIIGAALSGAALLLCLAGAAGAESRHWTLHVAGLDRIVEAHDGMPVVVMSDGRHQYVSIQGGKIVLVPIEAEPAAPVPAGALPDAVVTHGHEGGRAAMSAWLDQPTTRYGHAVLGDAIEAGGLSIRYADRSQQQLTLSADRVFEDRYARFTGLLIEGRQTLLTVTSYLNAGAALTLVDPGAAGGPGPRIIAEADPIGIPNRWLNPVGAGDVDGDGRIELLAVITPHIGGMLTAYELDGNKLGIEQQLHGFSNHAYGSRELQLSGLIDLDSPTDGVEEAVVPNADRTALTVVRFDRATPHIAASLAPGGQIVHRLVIRDLDGDGVPDLAFGTSDSTIVVWSPGL